MKAPHRERVVAIDVEAMERARRVRDAVERRVGARADVRMIDIGTGEGAGHDRNARPVVRVHVARPMRAQDLGLDAVIDGIDIAIEVAADYRPQPRQA